MERLEAAAVDDASAFDDAVEVAGRFLENIETVVHGKSEEVKLVLAALAALAAATGESRHLEAALRTQLGLARAKARRRKLPEAFAALDALDRVADWRRTRQYSLCRGWQHPPLSLRLFDNGFAVVRCK